MHDYLYWDIINVFSVSSFHHRKEKYEQKALTSSAINKPDASLPNKQPVKASVSCNENPYAMLLRKEVKKCSEKFKTSGEVLIILNVC